MKPNMIIMSTTNRSSEESNRGTTSIKSSSSAKEPDTKCKHRGKAGSRFETETYMPCGKWCMDWDDMF